MSTSVEVVIEVVDVADAPPFTHKSQRAKSKKKLIFRRICLNPDTIINGVTSRRVTRTETGIEIFLAYLILPRFDEE